jgi:hypothetical protein
MPKPICLLALVAALLLLPLAMARADAPLRIKVEPWCARTADRVGFHLAFDDNKSRTVFSLTCNRDSRECSGAKLELSGIERGGALGALSLGPVAAQLEHTGGEVSHIRWGNRIFTFNHHQGFVALGGVRASCHER